jgi:hypothetical protein
MAQGWLVAAAAAAMVLYHINEYSMLTLLAIISSCIFTGMLIYLTKRVHTRGASNEWHYAFWLDGMIVLQAVLVSAAQCV